MSGDAAYRAPLWWVARWCGRALTYLALAVLALSAGPDGQPYGWPAAAASVQANAVAAPAVGVVATPGREATPDRGVPPTREATPVHCRPATGGVPDSPLRPVGTLDVDLASVYAAAPAPPRAPPHHADDARPQAI